MWLRQVLTRSIASGQLLGPNDVRLLDRCRKRLYHDPSFRSLALEHDIQPTISLRSVSAINGAFKPDLFLARALWNDHLLFLLRDEQAIRGQTELAYLGSHCRQRNLDPWTCLGNVELREDGTREQMGCVSNLGDRNGE